MDSSRWFLKIEKTTLQTSRKYLICWHHYNANLVYFFRILLNIGWYNIWFWYKYKLAEITLTVWVSKLGKFGKNKQSYKYIEIFGVFFSKKGAKSRHSFVNPFLRFKKKYYLFFKKKSDKSFLKIWEEQKTLRVLNLPLKSR